MTTDHDAFDAAEFEHALQGYSAARDGTARGIRQAGVIGMIQCEEHAAAFSQQSLTILEGNLASLPSHEEKACRAGCAFCCHQRIDVTPVQALAIAGYLRATLPDPQLDRLRAKLQANAGRARQLSQADYARQRIRCALLDDDQCCEVYSVRPTACAGWHSMSKKRCEDLYQTASMGQEGVPADMAALLQARGFDAGLADAFADYGLDTRPYELHSAVLCALDTPDAVQAWLNRQPVFADCTPGVVLSNTVLRTQRPDGSVLTLLFRGVDADGATFLLDDSPPDPSPTSAED